MNRMAESINVMWVVCLGVHQLQIKQRVQCKYNVTWRVLVILFLLSWPNSQMAFHSKRPILCRFNVARNGRTYVGRHVKPPICFPDFNQIWIFSTDFHGSPIIKFHRNQSNGSRRGTCRLTDETKLIGAFRGCERA